MARAGRPAGAWWSARGAGGGTGIGLRNTRERLAQLYGDAYRLTVHRVAGAGTTVELTIPYRSASELPRRAAAERLAVAADGADSADPDGRDDLDGAAAAVPGRDGTRTLTVPLWDARAVPADANRGVERAIAPGVAAAPPAVAFRHIAAFWAAWAICWCVQVWLMEQSGVARPGLLRNYIVQWVGAGTWMVFTPVVLRLARLVRVTRARWLAPMAVHAALGAGFSALQVVSSSLLVGEGMPRLTPGLVTPASMNALIYLGIVAVVHARDLTAWVSARTLDADRLASELERTRLETLALELRPAFVGRVLERAAMLATEDAERAEAVVEQLADLLRALLDGATRASTVREELALLDASLALLALAGERAPSVEARVPPALLGAAIAPGALRRLLDDAPDAARPDGARPNGAAATLRVRGMAGATAPLGGAMPGRRPVGRLIATLHLPFPAADAAAGARSAAVRA
jgi:hypothetical protein